MASEAIKQTEKASRQKIERTLGVLASQEKRRNTAEGRTKGWVRIKNRILLQDSYAERIVAKRFKITGSWGGLKGNTIQEKALSFIRRSVRSVGFIRSGWIQAVKTLSAVVFKKPRNISMSDARQYGRPKGYARPAVFGLRSKIHAEIVNTALMAHKSNPPAPGGDPMPVAVRGLQMAMNVAARDMLAELARRLDPDFKAVSKR